MALLYVTTQKRGEKESLIHTTMEPSEVVPGVVKLYPESCTRSIAALVVAGTPVRAVYELNSGLEVRFHIVDLENCSGK